MKKVGMIIFSTIVLSSVLLLFNSCAEDVLTPDPIDLNAPVVKSISATSSTVLIGESVEVSVESDDASTYAWSADAGSFADPSAASTIYTAPVVEENTVVKLNCTITNSSGSRNASVSLKIATSLAPEGVSAWWPFDSDLSDNVSGTLPEGGAAVSIVGDGVVGDGAALFEGEDGNTESALFYDGAEMPMGPDDLFTIALWVKPDDDGPGFCVGRSFEEGEYVEGAKGLYIEEGVVIFDVSWIGEYALWDSDVRVNDGEWHHIAFVKGEEEAFIYVDGFEEFASEIEDWSDDEGTFVTIGAADEEPGAGWPGTFQGLMDDIRYYPEALSEDAIAEIAAE